jgi:casein kinase II subunit alpha
MVLSQPPPSVAVLSLFSSPQLLLLLVIIITSFVVHAERAYPLGCSLEHPSYYDYEPQPSSPFPPPGLAVKTVNDYLLVKRLGTGKFSDVFEAVDAEMERNLAPSILTTTPTLTNVSPSTTTPFVDPRTIVVLKCLKPVSERKIRREILVLQHASKLPNLARLLAIIVPDEYYKANRLVTQLPRMPSLVLEHAGPYSQWLSHHGQGGSMGGAEDEEQEDLPLSDYEIRYFLYHLLVGLDALHSIGIMHRDVKPRNALINRSTGRSRNNVQMTSPTTSVAHDRVANSTPRRSIPLRLPLPRPLMLIDLGLADFYRPGVKYNVRVASRHYKSPELLLGYEYYDYAIDMWGVACILAGLLWHREPFFRGKDNLDQLSRIITVLGTRDLIDYVVKYKMELTPQVRDLITRHHSFEQQQQQQQQLQAESTSPGSTANALNHRDSFWVNFQRSTLTADKDTYPAPPSFQALDLLNMLLVYDHDERLTAQQAMQHPYFDIVRARVHAEVRLYQRTVPVANLHETIAQSPVDSSHNMFDSEKKKRT